MLTLYSPFPRQGRHCCRRTQIVSWAGALTPSCCECGRQWLRDALLLWGIVLYQQALPWLKSYSPFLTQPRAAHSQEMPSQKTVLFALTETKEHILPRNQAQEGN